jgi:hypothetical protein
MFVFYREVSCVPPHSVRREGSAMGFTCRDRDVEWVVIISAIKNTNFWFPIEKSTHASASYSDRYGARSLHKDFETIDQI